MNHRTARLLSVAAAIVIAGCAGTGSVVETSPSDDGREVTPPAGPTSHATIRADLVQEVRQWLGTPYRYGGTSERGVDCSAFVQAVLADALGVHVPRSTRKQMEAGEKIDRHDLLVADLVFFRTPARTDHVGVYLGEGEFAHASTSSGVMVSALEEEYWEEAYRSARRVAAFPAAPTLHERQEEIISEAAPEDGLRETAAPDDTVAPVREIRQDGRRAGW